jgi:hypothetical protein
MWRSKPTERSSPSAMRPWGLWRLGMRFVRYNVDGTLTHVSTRNRLPDANWLVR